MNAQLIERRTHDPNPVAKLNRERLGQAGVFAVRVVGGPGCGKTSLIDATVERLAPDVHAGVVACDVASRLDTDRVARHTEQVVQVNTGDQGTPDATHVREA